MSTCPVNPPPPIAPLWVAASAVLNPTRRPNASSPSGPYIMPAGSENTVTASAGIVIASMIMVQPRPASPRRIARTPTNTPIGTVIPTSPHRVVTEMTAVVMALAISPSTVSQ